MELVWNWSKSGVFELFLTNSNQFQLILRLMLSFGSNLSLDSERAVKTDYN
jgi:hypothetical protein